jgi:hypothetical protein
VARVYQRLPNGVLAKSSGKADWPSADPAVRYGIRLRNGRDSFGRQALFGEMQLSPRDWL